MFTVMRCLSAPIKVSRIPKLKQEAEVSRKLEERIETRSRGGRPVKILCEN
jgi:hypothetical protein